MSAEENAAFAALSQHVQAVISNLKHCALLGIQVLDTAPGILTLELPYDVKIIGNPDNQIVHGGALTTLMDTACGFAAVLACSEPTIAPTLDLRIDYMRAATPGLAVIGKAEAYRVTPTVIFARGTAFHAEHEAQPIAHCTASFMRLQPNTESRT